MCDPLGQRQIGQETQVGAACCRAGRFGFKFGTLLMQVDLGISKPQCVTDVAIRCGESLRSHAQSVAIKLNGLFNINDSQNQMIQLFQEWFRLRHDGLPLYHFSMKPDPIKTASQSDVMDPARANAMQVALGKAADIGVATALPPFFHQLYFWEPQVAQTLGRDGHPKVGGLIPDMGLPRRMWAAGRLAFYAPLRAGVAATRTSICENATLKQGRSGPLGFVTLRHDVHQDGAICLSEWQDLVYREDPDPQAAKPEPPQARTDEEHRDEVTFSSTLLFRYSALTFNGHRIHYDLDYARDVEGYGGLVVHGPLLAQLLMLMAQDHLGALERFEFRATSPLMHHEVATLCLRGRDLWVRGPDGRQCMVAKA